MAQLIACRLRLLGPVRVDLIQPVQNKMAEHEVEGRTADEIPHFRSRRTIALLGFLAAERRPFARDFLTTLFWPDWEPSRGRANLRRDLHNLAQILPDCWNLDHQTVAFIPSTNINVDLYELIELETQERWEEAADLLGGEFLEGLYLDDNSEFENWILGERECWRGRAETIMTRVIEGYTRRGRYSDALNQIQHLLQLAPWNEKVQRQAMRLMTWTGQRGTALRQFEICKRTLKEELGVEPSSETIALYKQIHAGQLNLPPQLPAFLTDEEARHGFERPLFIGRECELERLDQFMAAAFTGQGRMVFITGGPGDGKTALLNAFSQRAMAMHPDLLVASGTCNAFLGLGDPYQPFRDMMAMLTGDVEGRWDAGAITRDHAQRLWAAISFVVQVVLDHGAHLLNVLIPGEALLSRAMAFGQDYAPWLPRLRQHIKRYRENTQELEQSQLFQQVLVVLRSVAVERPLLLILDDLQWLDTASISLLFHLGRHLTDAASRLLIVCAYRPEDVSLGRANERHPLAQPLNEFKRIFGDVWVNLGEIGESESRDFVGALLDTEPNRLGEDFRNVLFHRTGSNPLFTIELLHAMQERGDLIKDEDGCWIEGSTLDWDVLPARVDAVIAERIDRIDPGLQEVLTIASVEGEVFTAQVIAEVQNVPIRSILRCLSQDLERKHRLVREQEEVEIGPKRLSRYRFSHILFQNYLYKRLGQGEKRILHGDVAVALERLYVGQLDEIAVQLAHHFNQASDNENGFHYSILAAERAVKIYDSGESVTHYTRAIQLAEKISPDAVTLARLHRGRGLAYERLGAFERAHADHTEILRIARTAGENQVEWRAFLDLGKLWSSRDHYQARDYFEAALGLARHIDDPVLLASSLNWVGNWHMNNEDFTKSVAYHQEALSIFERLKDRRQLTNTLDLLGMADLLGGDFAASIQYYDRCIALCRELDERQRLASSLLGRAATVSMLVLLASVPVTMNRDPKLDINEAFQIAREVELVSEQVWAHYSIGLLCMLQADYGCGLKELQDGLQIASKFTHREWMLSIRFGLGMFYVELFDPDKARWYLDEALALANELHSPMWIHLVNGALAGAYFLLGDLDSAHACLEIVITPQTRMDTLGKRYCWVRWAELALARGDPVLALDVLDHLITSAPGGSPERVITYLWKLKADVLAASGASEEACSLLVAALKNAHTMGERFLLWRIHASLARLYITLGQQDTAEKEFSTARVLIGELAASIPDQALKENFHKGAYQTLEVGLGWGKGS